MRTIEVKIKGILYYIDYCDYSEEDIDNGDYEYDSLMLLEPITIEVEGETYQKDEYTGNLPWQSKQTPYWAYITRFMEFPLHIWVLEQEETCVYQLQLDDKEKFDIGKLQFIQSYELNMFEDAGVYSVIHYDGRPLVMDPEEDDNHVACVQGNFRTRIYEIEEFDDEVTPSDPDYVPVPWGQKKKKN